ncbi:MAG: tetratricopeptide repeat protein [Rubrivivax sp.]|jgi:tetratricopeptide (TPR) repeat protein
MPTPQPSLPRLRTLFTTLALAATGPALLPAQAADPAPPPEPVAQPSRLADPLAPARMLIKAQRWPEAIATLKQVNATGNADWQNLMGYTHRKQATPDLAAAERYYNQALKLEPTHRGALEYSGELYLMLGQLPQAESRLATLNKVCNGACEELDDLKAAVAKFKANGNKWSPK